MPTLSITKNYATGQTLTKAELDSAYDSISTFLNSTKIDSSNIQSAGVSEDNLASSIVSTAKIANDAVTTAKVLDANITTGKLADSSVTAVKLATDSVTTIKVLDANITAAKLATDSVTTLKIADSNVTTAKLANGSVTQVKRAARTTGTTAGVGDIALSNSCGAFSTSGASVAVTNLSCTLTTNGGPVQVSLVGDGSGSSGYINSGGGAVLSLKRGATYILPQLLNSVSTYIPVGSMTTTDVVAAGTYTYTVEVSSLGGAAFQLYYAKLEAYEK